MFSLSAVVAFFVFGNLASGRPQDLQQADGGKEVSTIPDSGTVSAPSNQYVAYGGNNGLLDTSGSTGSEASTDTNAPPNLNGASIDQNALTASNNVAAETNPYSDGEIPVIEGENTPALDQSVDIASKPSPLGIPWDHYKADSAACAEVRDPKSETHFVIYAVQEEPTLDITVAVKGTGPRTGLGPFAYQLQKAGKGYAVLGSNLGLIGVINLLNPPKPISIEQEAAFYNQGIAFFDSMGKVSDNIEELQNGVDLAAFVNKYFWNH